MGKSADMDSAHVLQAAVQHMGTPTGDASGSAIDLQDQVRWKNLICDPWGLFFGLLWFESREQPMVSSQCMVS